jgi:formate dehydrogenase beta subunit
VQYENGIVDVNQDKCIGCGYCATGCPFNVPKFHTSGGKMAKCTLCVDRIDVGLEPACIKACPTGCLNFGTKEDMVALGNGRVKQLKASGFKDAVLYDPQGVNGTSVVTVLKYNKPDWYELPADPRVGLLVRGWKNVLRPLGVFAAFAAVVGTFAHFATYGPKAPPEDDDKADRGSGQV